MRGDPPLIGCAASAKVDYPASRRQGQGQAGSVRAWREEMVVHR